MTHSVYSGMLNPVHSIICSLAAKYKHFSNVHYFNDYTDQLTISPLHEKDLNRNLPKVTNITDIFRAFRVLGDKRRKPYSNEYSTI